MKSTCHQCGREYLTARNLAGKAIACRSCGALNDGAGGPPPAPPPKAADASRPRPTGGAAFTVGGALPKVDPRALEREIQAAEAAEASVPNARGVSMMNRAVLALGIGAVALAFVLVGALFVVRYIEQNPAGSRDWSGEMLATPQILGEAGAGSGFLIELGDTLWIVTNFHVIQGETEVDIVFPNPETGKEMFRIADQRVEKFRLHRRFLETLTSQTDGIHFDIAAISVEDFRDALEARDISPRGLLPSNRVRAGQEIYAIGHPATGFGFSDETDSRSDGTARHTLTSGLVSAVRRADDRPTVVQFDAAVNPGNSGGPLFNADGDVIAVVTWRDVERKAGGGTESRQGMSFGVATDHVVEVTRDGIGFGDMSRQFEMLVALAGVPSDPRQGRQHESWETFPQLRPSLVRTVREGWGAEQALAVRISDVDGQFVGDYTIVSADPTDLYIVLLPESRMVDADIASVQDDTGAVLGQDIDTDPGDIAEVVVPGLAPGAEVSIDVRTFFGGTGVPARFLILVYERRAGHGGVGAGPTTPPQPPVPPVNPAPGGAFPGGLPTTPGPGGLNPPGSTAPGSTAPGSTAPGSTAPGSTAPAPPSPARTVTGKARTIDLIDGMADTVYASSLIGLRDFDKRYLTNIAEQDAFDMIEAAFIDGTPNLVPNDPSFARDIMRASLQRSFYFPVANGVTLPHSRPLSEVHLDQVPAATSVGVYLEIDPVWSRYLSLPPGGLVSRSSDIKLVPGALTDGVRHDPTTGAFRIPLDLPWKDEELRTLAQSVEIPYTLVARYDDSSEDRLSGRIRVNPVAQVEHAYPFGASIASLVDEGHPWIRRMVDEINQRPDVSAARVTLVGGGGGPADRLASLYLVWQDLVRRGLRYQNLTAADGIAQRCRLVHESISSGNANCLDGTVLLASFMQAIGIDSYLVLMPGHALLCIDGGDQWIFVETTAAGQASPGNPTTAYDASFEVIRRRHGLFRTPELDLLEHACGSALDTVLQQLDQARQVLATYRAMSVDLEQRWNDPAWRAQFESVLMDLSEQIMIVPVSLARANGVRPVGSPSNLDQTHRIPPRR